jgi:histidinol-phosphate aminotransferase
MFASPDNPTGDQLDLGLLDRWCSRFSDTLFVFDEAYAEYSGKTALPLLAKHKNLLVTRTFSKAWSLAGLRLGVILGDSELIQSLNKVRLPFTVNASAAAAALELIPERARVAEAARKTMKRKAVVLSELDARRLKYVSGYANFFLLNMGEYAADFCIYLRQRGVLVRNRSFGTQSDNPLWGMVRISIGTEAENQILLQAVDAFNQERAASCRK